MTQTGAAPTEANRKIIRQAFESWHQGTGAITDEFAADMVWRIEGHSVVSKEYASKQQFIDEVLGPFGARFTASDPFRPTAIRSVCADGDMAIVLWDGRGIAIDGQPYENSYAWFMTLRDGRVIDGTAFYDSISFNELWARSSPAEISHPGSLGQKHAHPRHHMPHQRAAARPPRRPRTAWPNMAYKQ